MSLALAILICVLIMAGTAVYGGHVLKQVAANGTPGARRAAGSARIKGKQAAASAGQSVRQIRAHHFSQAKAAAWLERQQRRWARSDARRANGTHVSQWPGHAVRRLGRTGSAVRQRVRDRRATSDPGTVQPPAAAPGSSTVTPPASANGHGPQQTNGHAPTASTNGRAHTPMTTTANGSSGVSSDMFTAAQQLTSQSLAGGLQSKRRGIHTLSEALDYIGTVVTQFGQRLSEPDQGYPASIWEPLTTAGAHVKAAAASAGESDSALAALSAMNVGELAGSATQAPHHDELNHE